MRSFSAFASYGFLCVSLSVGALVACGGGESPPPQTPPTPSATTSNTAAPTATTTTAATTSAAPQQAAVEMKPLTKSALIDKLKEAGLDPKKLPKLSKVERSKLGKVMTTFTAALGYKCIDCHTDDFKAWTPKKHIAEHMWDEFVVGLAQSDGSALYCDSCHQGRALVLDHRDKKALSGWMQTNYVDGLKRTDGKEHGCETCHGDPFDGEILERFEK